MNSPAPAQPLDFITKRAADVEDTIRRRIDEIRETLLGSMPEDPNKAETPADGSLGRLESTIVRLSHDASMLGDVLDRLRTPAGPTIDKHTLVSGIQGVAVAAEGWQR